VGVRISRKQVVNDVDRGLKI